MARSKKEVRIYLSLALLFILSGVFVYYIDSLILKQETERLELRKENVHQRAISQFTSSIENFAILISSLRSFIKNSDEMPTAQQLQAFTNQSLEKVAFDDSLVISYVDASHIFIYSFDRNTINENQLKGVNVASIRSAEEIAHLNRIMEDEELHLGAPMNLVEGWLGIPLNFNISRDGQSIGYIAPIINFRSIMDAVYEQEISEDFILKFTTGDGFTFDRRAIYDGSTIYNDDIDPEYFGNFQVKDTFLTSTINYYGLDLTLGTAFKHPEVSNPYRSILTYTWFALVGVILVYLGNQYIRDRRTSRFLVQSKAQISDKNRQLASQKAEYEALLSNVGDGVYELDGDGKCTFINSRMLQMLNMTEDQVNVISVWDLIEPNNVKGVKDFFASKIRSKADTFYVEYQIKPIDGDPIWIGQTTTMEYEGDRMVLSRTIARDLTENIELKRKLEVNESLFKLVSENSSDLIALHETDGTYKFVSGASIDLVGFKPSELEGRSVFDFIHPNDVPRLRSGVDRRTLKGESVDQIEYRFKRKDESYVWMESYAKPIVDEDGEVIAFQTSSRDITVQREESKQLRIAKEKAEEASEAKADFLSMMSHEIRTPLNGIIGTTHLLLNKAPNKNQLPHLNILKQSGDNLHAIVNDILDFSKIEEGKIEIDNSKFSLRNMAQVIHHNYAIQASEKRIDFSFNYDESLTEFYRGDSVRISQVLHNLVSNAIKFTERGGVTLSLKKVGEHDDFDEISFEVTDTGVGIPASQQDNVFEKFVQAEKTTAAKYGGSGLGLSITKNLLQLMNSEIEMETTEGEGSRFHFKLVLPRLSTEASEVQDYDDMDNFGTLDANVLLVEDNDFNREIAKDFLKSWGCTVEEAHNGKEALEALKSQFADLVLIDLQMPVMDGFETIKIIRESSEQYLRDLPVIALTAAALGDTKEKVFASGMNDFIAKPFLPLEFYNKLASCLTRKEPAESQEKIGALLKKKLEANLDPEKVGKYLEIFKQTMGEEILKLEEAISAQNIEQVRAYAHKVKSSFRLVGLEELAEEAEEMEEMVDKKSPDSMILNKADFHFNQVKINLKELADSP